MHFSSSRPAILWPSGGERRSWRPLWFTSVDNLTIGTRRRPFIVTHFDGCVGSAFWDQAIFTGRLPAMLQRPSRWIEPTTLLVKCCRCDRFTLKIATSRWMKPLQFVFVFNSWPVRLCEVQYARIFTGAGSEELPRTHTLSWDSANEKVSSSNALCKRQVKADAEFRSTAEYTHIFSIFSVPRFQREQRNIQVWLSVLVILILDYNTRFFSFGSPRPVVVQCTP